MQDYIKADKLALKLDLSVDQNGILSLNSVDILMEKKIVQIVQSKIKMENSKIAANDFDKKGGNQQSDDSNPSKRKNRSNPRSKRNKTKTQNKNDVSNRYFIFKNVDFN